MHATVPAALVAERYYCYYTTAAATTATATAATTVYVYRLLQEQMTSSDQPAFSELVFTVDQTVLDGIKQAEQVYLATVRFLDIIQFTAYTSSYSSSFVTSVVWIL